MARPRSKHARVDFEALRHDYRARCHLLPEGALEQLWYVDAAYLAAVALANFMFPYILLPTALNPMQLMIPPNDVDIPMAAGVAEKPLKLYRWVRSKFEALGYVGVLGILGGLWGVMFIGHMSDSF